MPRDVLSHIEAVDSNRLSRQNCGCPSKILSLLTISPLTARPSLCAAPSLSYVSLFLNSSTSSVYSLKHADIITGHFSCNFKASATQISMRQTSLLVGLSYVFCLVLATRLRAIGDHVTYQCSGKVLHSGLPRLDEASIDDLNALQASGAVNSVELVHACFALLFIHSVRY